MPARVIAIVVGIVLLVAGGLYWVFFGGGPEPEPIPTATPAPVEEPVETPVEPAPEPSLTLPALAESDSLARGLLGELTSHPGVEPILDSDGLVRTFVVVVVNVTHDDDPRGHVEYLEPEGDFSVVERDGQLFIDPASYQRYDRLADTFVSVDAPGAVRVFRRIEPLLDRAYQDLGYPDGRFAGALERAMERLLATPIPFDDVEVVEGVESYEFADPELEALSPSQKQLLRTGARNARRIQAKLRELRELMIAAGVFPTS